MVAHTKADAITTTTDGLAERQMTNNKALAHRTSKRRRTRLTSFKFKHHVKYVDCSPSLSPVGSPAKADVMTNDIALCGAVLHSSIAKDDVRSAGSTTRDEMSTSDRHA